MEQLSGLKASLGNDRIGNVLGDPPAPRVKAYYKYQLAAMYNISTRTLANWLAMYAKELAKLGYTKHCKILRPEVVRFIFERFDVP